MELLAGLENTSICICFVYVTDMNAARGVEKTITVQCTSHFVIEVANESQPLENVMCALRKRRCNAGSTCSLATLSLAQQTRI